MRFTFFLKVCPWLTVALTPAKSKARERREQFQEEWRKAHTSPLYVKSGRRATRVACFFLIGCLILTGWVVYTCWSP